MAWPDFKLTNYAFSDNGKHVRQRAAGLILLHGADRRMVDYERTTFSRIPGGIPVFTMHNDIGVSVSLEAFCDFDENPRLFARLRLYNDRACSVTDSISLITATGDEGYLSTSNDTAYSIYRPRVGTWYLLPKRFRRNGLLVDDGESFFEYRPSSNLTAEWNEAEGICDKFSPDRYMSFAFTLEPGEEAILEIAHRYGSCPGEFDYDAERQKTIDSWKSLLEDVRILPNTDNGVYLDIYYAMITQSMQMFARYWDGPGRDRNWIIPRQGDVGCFVWPWEAASYLIPLDRIGMRQYTGAVYRYFIDRWFTDAPGTENDGKIISGHQQWGNLTGSVIWGICEHCLIVDDRKEIEYFKPYLERMADWIMRERARSADNPGDRPGLFPSGKASDWNDTAQYWCFTDATNVHGLRCMVRLYERIGDEKAGKIRAAYEEYRDTILDIVRELSAGHEDDECFILPHQLDVPFEDTETYCFYVCGAPSLFETGLLDPKDRLFGQMDRYFEKRGFFHNGLTGRMTSISGGGYELYEEVYYTVDSDKTWLEGWLARGEREKADRTFKALMTYCITPEYIVSERYSPDNEWFSPWQPNGGSSGRIISIMLSYFGERDAGRQS